MRNVRRGTAFRSDVGLTRLPSERRFVGADRYTVPHTLTARADMARVERQISKIIDSVEGLTPTILVTAMIPIYEQALAWCPEDTGELRESARLDVDEAIRGGGRLRASISYGNAQAWYAPLVHERTWIHHDPPTRAKWLQEAMEQGVGDLKASLPELVRQAAGL